MDRHTKAVFKKQIAKCRAAVRHLNDAADLLKSAKVDDLPDDIRDQAVSIECLVNDIEEHLNPPSAEVIQIRDYHPITG